MNKALRFVWLSLLTLICGVASAGTVVFDPATDSGGGTSLSKDGIIFKITSGNSTLAPSTKDGTPCFQITGNYEFATDGVTGNMTKITLYYLSGSYVYCNDYYISSADVSDDNGTGKSYYSSSSSGFSRLPFRTFSSNVIYISKVVIEYIGDAPSDGTVSIDKLSSGKQDVQGAKIKFTNAQVVYKEDNGGTYNYIVREGGKALDMMGTALNFDLGATLNGTVTMDVTYNSGILKATDAAETSDADLTKSESSDKYLPVTTTLANIANNAGDLIYLEKVSLYHDTYNDLGGGSDAYYFRTGNSFALISNYAEVADKLADAAGTYLVTAWYNASGTGMVAASLKVIDAQMPLSAPVITAAEESFAESTTVTITATDGATIYYTLDNSTPQSAWGTTYTYNVPFTIYQTTTVKAVAVKDGVTSDVAEKTFNGPSTIADLYNSAQSQTNVLLKLTDAKVVYADGNGNYILRENGKALDVLNTSLDLKQGTVLNGTVQLNVNYTYGILSTSDIYGTTNADKLTVTGEESTEPDPIVCTTLSEIKNYPGDLIKKDNMLTYGSYAEAYENGSWNYIYFLNYSDFGISSGKTYDILGWYSSVYYSNPRLKIVQADPVITYLYAPTIDGTTPFTDNTTVTITSSESVASIYYTTNGEEPTISSMKYDGSFTLTETATVKAIAVYKNIVSSVATKEFTKLDLTTPKTIAELHQLAMNLDEATVRFDNAQVVYAEVSNGKYNYIVRENDQALDIMNTSLQLVQGKTLTGTVKLNVNYSDGFLTTSDLSEEGETNDADLTASGEASAQPLPITCNDRADVQTHRGDLVYLENKPYYYYYYGPYLHDGNYNIITYLSNYADFDLVSGNQYNVILWYNSDTNNTPYSRIIKKVINHLDAPTISGEKNFAFNTTVTLTSSESVASIYYTTNGDEPTTSSSLYDRPFTLTESATVKAIAVYDDVISPVATEEFTKVDPYVARTISELGQLKLNFEATTVKLEDALVVYGDGSGSFILRDKDNKALDVLNTSLPLTVGATVSGTVMVKINFAANEWHSNGVLSTTDIEQTNAENLTIVEGETTLPSPLTVNLVDAPNYPGDLLEVSNVQGWVSYGSYSFWTSGSEDIYLSNGADYGVISNNAYNALIWYNDAKDNNCWSKIVGLKQTLDYTITSVGWGTLILPFSTEKPAGVTVYECTGVQKDANTGVGTLQVEERNCLMANTPYILKGVEGAEMPFSFEGYAAKQTQEQYSNGVMTGVLSALTAPTGSYVLQNQPDVDGLAFYIVLESQNFSMTPYRCYINAQNDPTLRAIRFPGTEINGIYGATAANGLVDVFTTTGVKVKNQVERAHALDGLSAGVYIINNQKVIKK